MSAEKELKTKYHQYRKETGLTRDQASEIMGSEMSVKRIERIEYGEVQPDPYDIVEMADAYNKPEMCNEYCVNECPIGQRYVPAVEIKDLSKLALKTLTSLNHLNKDKERLVEICEDGVISDDEIEDFENIRTYINNISTVANALNIWIDEFMKDAE